MRSSGSPTAWDDLSISHTIWSFTPDLLAIEFSVGSYYAGAAHPNTNTHTLNFKLHPSTQLEVPDLFQPSSNYLTVLSEYCVADLHKQQPSRWYGPRERAEELEVRKDEWILSGAGPQSSNFERFVILKGGMRIFFDPYQVGSYAEGKYDVFLPYHVLAPILKESAGQLLR
jgi:hypothetical protein